MHYHSIPGQRRQSGSKFEVGRNVWFSGNFSRFSRQKYLQHFFSRQLKKLSFIPKYLHFHLFDLHSDLNCLYLSEKNTKKTISNVLSVQNISYSVFRDPFTTPLESLWNPTISQPKIWGSRTPNSPGLTPMFQEEYWHQGYMYIDYKRRANSSCASYSRETRKESRTDYNDVWCEVDTIWACASSRLETSSSLLLKLRVYDIVCMCELNDLLRLELYTGWR